MKKENIFIGVGVGIFLVVLGVWYCGATLTPPLSQWEREKEGGSGKQDKIPDVVVEGSNLSQQTQYRQRDIVAEEDMGRGLEVVGAGAGSGVAVASGAKKETVETGIVFDPEFKMEHPEFSGKVATYDFEVASKLYGNPKIRVRYSIALDESGKPFPESNQVIFFAPHPNEDFEKSFKSNPGWTKWWGYTFFTVEIRTEDEVFRDRSRCYYYAESGVHEAILEAHRQILARHGLKKEPFFVVGYSGGGCLATSLGLYNDRSICAVIVDGVPTLDMPTKKSNIPWMLIFGRGEGNADLMQQFAGVLRGKGTPVIEAMSTPNFWGNRMAGGYAHGGGVMGKPLMEAYVRGIIALREENGKVRPYREWPFVTGETLGSPIYENTPEMRAEIPDGQRIYLPSKEFASVWSQLTPRAREICIEGATPNIRLKGIFPSEGRRKGVVLLRREYDHLTLRDLVEDAHYLAFQRMVVLYWRPSVYGKKLTEKEEAEFVDTALMPWVREQEELEGLPVYYLGYYDRGHGVLRELAAMGGGTKFQKAALVGVSPMMGEEEWVSGFAAENVLESPGEDGAGKGKKKVRPQIKVVYYEKDEAHCPVAVLEALKGQVAKNPLWEVGEATVRDGELTRLPLAYTSKAEGFFKTTERKGK